MGKPYLKKITTSVMGLDVVTLEDAAANARGANVPIMRVGGRVSQSTLEQGNYGVYFKFEGEFEAVNLLTGEASRSKILIVPTVAETIIDGILKETQEENPGAMAPVGVDITVRENKSSKGGVKFTFGAVSLIKGEKKDALDSLMEALGPLPKAIPDKRDDDEEAAAAMKKKK